MDAPCDQSADCLVASVAGSVVVRLDALRRDAIAFDGKFPDKTVLVMDVYRAGDKEPKNIVSQGHFEAEQVGFEVGVKNGQRPDGSKTVCAYYVFPSGVFPSGSGSAPAQPDSACYQCHLEHAKDDNVWVQFYPVLQRP